MPIVALSDDLGNKRGLNAPSGGDVDVPGRIELEVLAFGTSK